jgi:hypothetical protein
MERADFIHMVRLSEHASADDSLAYRRKLALFAALGYRWVVGCILLGIGLARWAFGNLMHDRFRASYIGLQVVVGSLLWASLCSLWVRLPATMLRPVGRRGLWSARWTCPSRCWCCGLAIRPRWTTFANMPLSPCLCAHNAS